MYVKVVVGIQDKRAREHLHNAQVAEPSRLSKRTRRRSGPHQTLGIPSPPIRTIYADDVEGIDFIFRFPLVGDGYYIIRCDRYESTLGGIIHQFKEDPFEYRRAVRHFSLLAPRPRCHLAQDQEFCSEEEIVRKFGYRVIDDKGNDVSSEWVTESNARLTRMREKEKAKKAAAKGKHKAHARNEWNIQYADANRENRSATAPRRSGAAMTVEGSSTERIPVADMALDSSRETLRSTSDDTVQQVEDEDDIMINPVVSDIIPTSDQAAQGVTTVADAMVDLTV
ncbi:hypothetical protein VTI74DRAFT_1244 [Chaetomium olivicolor]